MSLSSSSSVSCLESTLLLPESDFSEMQSNVNFLLKTYQHFLIAKSHADSIPADFSSHSASHSTLLLHTPHKIVSTSPQCTTLVFD